MFRRNRWKLWLSKLLLVTDVCNFSTFTHMHAETPIESRATFWVIKSLNRPWPFVLISSSTWKAFRPFDVAKCGIHYDDYHWDWKRDEPLMRSLCFQSVVLHIYSIFQTHPTMKYGCFPTAIIWSWLCRFRKPNQEKAFLMTWRKICTSFPSDRTWPARGTHFLDKNLLPVKHKFKHFPMHALRAINLTYF